ncbi:MAG TPA: hypothetical protein V6C97_01080, partial [Oculatellaceae cyanobacterium]
ESICRKCKLRQSMHVSAFQKRGETSRYIRWTIFVLRFLPRRRHSIPQPVELPNSWLSFSPVHVGHLDLVVIEQDELQDSQTREVNYAHENTVAVQCWTVEQTYHGAKTHLANAASCEHLSRDTADASDTHNGDRNLADVLQKNDVGGPILSALGARQAPPKHQRAQAFKNEMLDTPHNSGQHPFSLKPSDGWRETRRMQQLVSTDHKALQNRSARMPVRVLVVNLSTEFINLAASLGLMRCELCLQACCIFNKLSLAHGLKL